MADNTKKVRYQAVADFLAVRRNVKALKKDVDALRKAESELNAQAVAGDQAAAASAGRHSKERDKLAKAVEGERASVRGSTKDFLDNAKAIRETESATQGAARGQEALGSATEKVENLTRRARREQERGTSSTGRAVEMTRRQAREVERMQARMAMANNGVSKFQKGLTKLADWRPRLTPPFVVLIPLVAGLLGLINPLVAGVGALAAAGFGLATSLGSVAGVLATGLIPGIATAIGLVAALKTAFGGIGGAFKAFGAMQKAQGGGGGGSRAKEELSDAEKLQRAQEKYARAIQDVHFAEEDLDEARKDYLKRLNDLRKAVDRAALSEARAAANSQLARENLANVLADPGSTKGAKMDASASVGEARADYNDVLEENAKNQADLIAMQQKGIEGDRQVIQATRALTDAINAQRDAQLDLANEASGANKVMSGGASASNKWQEALNKLSPSARAFVLTLVGLQKAWQDVQRTVQEAFFGEAVQDFALLERLLPPIQSMLVSIAGAAGRVFSRFIQLVTSAAWIEDIYTFGRLAAPVIERVGDGILFLLTAFKDITIAAMPFLTALATSFAEGAKNFGVFVANARATGSLAKWLEQGRQRLVQWWAIIKNIGKTLFNYGAAAGPFADWLTAGLRSLTEGWLKNSQAARKAGSPFQKFLEDIKPLLSEVSGLVGDFFQWFSGEAMDPENIKQIQEIFHDLRTETGPALKKIFDSLSNAKIGPKLVEGITKLLEFVGTILNNGGAATLSTFFDFLGGLLDVLKAIASIPGAGGVLTVLGTALAAMSALSFVGQFTGLTKLLGLLINLGKGGGPGIISKLMALLGMPVGAGGGGGRLGSPAPLTPSTSINPSTGLPFGSRAERKAYEKTIKAPKTGPKLPKVAKGGIAAILASLGVGAISDAATQGALTGNPEADAKLNELNSNVQTGAVIGGTLGSFGGVEGAAIGTAAGATIGTIASSDDPVADWLSGFETIKEAWLSGFDSIRQYWVDGFNTITQPLQDVGANLHQFFTVDLPNGWNNFWGGIGASANAFFTQTLPNAWNNFVNNVRNGWNTLTTNIRTWWQGLVDGVRTGWSNLIAGVRGFFTGLIANWQSGFTGFIAWLRGIWVDLPGKIVDAIRVAVNALIGLLNGILGGIGIKIPTLPAAGGSGKKKKHYGGVIRRAGGGGVPGSGNSDSVPALLTPGEVVIRKEIVDRVGEKNLLAFNAGVKSYAQMLQEAMASQPGSSKNKDGDGTGLSFFNGGGLAVSPNQFPGGGNGPGPGAFGGAPGDSGGGNMSFGDIIIYNPAPEPASDSLPRSIRKAAYLGSKR